MKFLNNRLHFILLMIFITGFSFVTPDRVFSATLPTSSPATASPVLLIIPKLNVVAGFQYTGLKSDGTMDIPNNIVDVGWFTGSPEPGEKVEFSFLMHEINVLTD